MGRSGFGFFGRYRGVALDPGGGSYIGRISPSPQWTGAAGSGFPSPPADPARTTAKPVLQLIVPPRQAFTKELLVGVYAGANNHGSLMDNMGLQKVIAHYEGNRIDITEPSFRVFADAQGRPVTYYGWWIKLQHNGASGLANLYFEAVPADVTMQRRVIGPYLFLPSVTLYDYDVEVAPSKPTIAGTRFQSMTSAFNYLRSVSAQRPRIHITESMTDPLTGPSNPYVSGTGYCTIEASAPVTIAKTSATKSECRPPYARIRLRGANITLDMRYIARFRPYSAGNWQFDGVTFVNSGGRGELWNKNVRPALETVEFAYGENPWFTECTITDGINPLMNRACVRGCQSHKSSLDLADNCKLLIGCTVDDHDAGDYLYHIDAMAVQYLGTAATATMSLTGTGGHTRTFTVKENGDVVATFIVQTTNPSLDTYNVADVVNWLNGKRPGTTGVTLSGWSATLLDDSRLAKSLGLKSDLDGLAFTDVDMKSAAVPFTTHFELHPDLIQRLSDDENTVIADNVFTNIKAQSLFFNLYNIRDVLVLNNVFHQKPGNGYLSQLAGSMTGSHIVVAHNTWVNQAVLLSARVNSGGYSLIANNVMPDLTGSTSDPMNHNNHLMAGATGSGGIGGTVGGTAATLFADVTHGNFAASGALLDTARRPIVKYDRLCRPRQTLAPLGASR